MLYSTSKKTSNEYIFGQYAKYWEQTQLSNSSVHFDKILSLTNIAFVYPRVSK